MKRLLVVGGNGFVGKAVCRRAVRRKIQVTSLSRSGRPMNETGEWADKVEWKMGDANDPDVAREAVEECDAIVSTVGTMVDSSWPAGARQLYMNMKKNFQSGGGGGGIQAGLAGLANVLNSASSTGSFDASGDSTDGENTYERLNRDVHLTVASAASRSESVSSFVYFSAVPPNVLNSKVPLVQRYFSTKMETENALQQYDPNTLRCPILRPTVMYDDEHLHTLAPAALSKVSSLLDSMVFAQFGFRDVPHLLPSPPVFVDTVAECAIEAAFDNQIQGVLELADISRISNASTH